MKKIFKNHFSLAAFIIIALVIFGLYAKSIMFDWQFLDDDILILEKQDYLKLSNIYTMFTDSFFGVDGDTGYRPLLNVSFAIDRTISGLNPISYHISNILIFLLTIFSIYLFFSYKNNKVWSLFFSLLISVNPLLCPIVCRPVDRSESLLTLFAVASFYFLLRFIETAESWQQPKKVLFLVLHLLFFVTALFTKETAIVLPFIYIFFFLFFSSSYFKSLPDRLPEYQSFSRSRLVYIVFLYIAIVTGYLFLHYIAVGASSYTDTIYFYVYSVANNFIVVIKYFYNLLFPMTNKLTPVQDIILFVLTLLVFVLIFIKMKYKNIKVVSFAGISFILFLLPTMIMWNNMHSYAQNRIFLPMICGYYVLLNCLQKYKINGNKIIMAVLIFVLIGYSYTTFFKMDRYYDRWTAFIGELNDTPDSPYINAKFAMLLADICMYDKAEQHMLKAINLEPYNIYHYSNLALIYYKKGDVSRAKELAEFADRLKITFDKIEVRIIS